MAKTTNASDTVRRALIARMMAPGAFTNGSLVTTHGAVDFIVEHIVDEAARQGIALTDVERRVLYFAESRETPSEMLESVIRIVTFRGKRRDANDRSET